MRKSTRIHVAPTAADGSHTARTLKKLAQTTADAMEAGAKAEKQERDIFTLEQLKLIFEKFPGKWPDMVAVTLLLGGLRLGDVATLQWRQIRWEAGLVEVTAQKTNRGMTKPLIPALRRILERRQQADFMGGAGAVFPYAAARANKERIGREHGDYLSFSG